MFTGIQYIPCVWKTEGPRPTPDIARSVVDAFEVLYLLAVDPAPPPEVPLPADPATPSIFNTCPSSTVMVCTDEPFVGWICNIKKCHIHHTSKVLTSILVISIKEMIFLKHTCTTSLSEILAGVLRLPCNSAARSEKYSSDVMICQASQSSNPLPFIFGLRCPFSNTINCIRFSLNLKLG